MTFTFEDPEVFLPNVCQDNNKTIIIYKVNLYGKKRIKKSDIFAMYSLNPKLFMLVFTVTIIWQ